MGKIAYFLSGALIVLAACDLQPRIVALPDTVGEFISARYPALLADPTSQPEIYNSAATDYGVYAAPEIYGTGVTTDDYVLYANVDDYIAPDDIPEPVIKPETIAPTATENVATNDTLIVKKRVIETAEPEWTPVDDTLNVPKYIYGGNNDTEITVVRGDTLYAIGAKYGMKVDEIAKLNNLAEPYNLFVGQKLRVRASTEQVMTEIPKIAEPVVAKKTDIKPTTTPNTKQKPEDNKTGQQTMTRVDLKEIKVEPGDTLFSISRKYSVPVNDLAVMNNIGAPFALYAGQTVRVPTIAMTPIRSVAETPKTTTVATTPSATESKTGAPGAKNKPTKDKSDSNTKKSNTKKTDNNKTTKAVTKLPAITARSSSKFSWPVRGKILSGYGAKKGGLFNDGINISASRGAAVAAAENGVVAYAGNEVKGMGNLIIIQHADGWMTVYAHLDSLAVRRGAQVRVGQKIGTVGQTGKVDKPQLHFEVRKGTRAYNPTQYLKK